MLAQVLREACQPVMAVAYGGGRVERNPQPVGGWCGWLV